MTMPPQGGWGPPPDPRQQPGGYPQSPGGYPQYGPGPSGPYPPGGWPGGQQPKPPKKGNGLKWALIALSVILVIGLSVTTTLLLTRGGGNGGGSTPGSTNAASDYASANDTGPVSIITEEPTCDAYTDISNALADVQNNGWSEESESYGPAASWTTDQRAKITAVATATRNVADRLPRLALKTPHRVMRELYQQVVIYGRAFADALDTYTPADLAKSNAFINASNAIVGICAAIRYGSASRGIALDRASGSASSASQNPPADSPLISKADAAVCSDWKAADEQFSGDTRAWESIDPAISSTAWTPEQRSTIAASLPAFTRFGDTLESLSQRSVSQSFSDIAMVGVQYIRAYVSSADNYQNADSWLFYTPFRVNNFVLEACKS